MPDNTVTIYCDGLCEPRNPGGHACYGWVAYNDQSDPNPAAMDSGCVGHGEGMTNNVAEYHAVIRALIWAYKEGYTEVLIRTDSQLVVNQVEGLWSCNAPNLHRLLGRVRGAQKYINLRMEWIPRERNEEADTLSRYAYKQVTGQEAPVREKPQTARR